MRTISLNGYIDEEVWYGDEITPGYLHDELYGKGNANADDVRIVLNSYGGNCNAATRMFDDVRSYPGKVHLVISGTAASAASVLSLAAERVEMTPGSLFMIHDPSCMAWGNEQDLNDAIRLLRACKESILNVYARRSHRSREELSNMMSTTTWMDAQQALAEGFIDGIVDEVPSNNLFNCVVPRTVDRAEAEAKVKAWLDRARPQRPRPAASVQPVEPEPTTIEPTEPEQPAQAPEQSEEPVTQEPAQAGTPVAQLQKRLGLIMPTRR